MFILVLLVRMHILDFISIIFLTLTLNFGIHECNLGMSISFVCSEDI